MRPEGHTTTALERELAQLAQSPIAILRARWRATFRSDPPPAFGKPLRCAIYTRKSTEHGLELEFNSLEGQRFGISNEGDRLHGSHYVSLGCDT